MKSSFPLLILASVLMVGCAGSSPLAPTAASPTRATSSSVPSGSAEVRSLLPPINPTGISCPSDAPQVMLGSLGTRLDIEFSEIIGASSYEIEIVNVAGETIRVEVGAPAHRAEWYGSPGMYRVRVRTVNCGGFGNWSDEVIHSLQEGPALPAPSSPTPPTPPGSGPTDPELTSCSMTPAFNVQTAGFVFRPTGTLRSATVIVDFSSEGAWELQLVASSSANESNTSSQRATGGTVKTSSGVTLACGQSGTRYVYEGAHTWKYWWFRIYRNGALVYTSDRYSA
jgi:hypothetical protein